MGTAVVSQIQDDRWLSLVIAFYILYELFKPKKMPSIRVEGRGYFWVGILIGAMGMFVGATGLILGVFILNSSLTKEESVANQAAMQTFNHALKIIGYLWIGTDAVQEGPAFLVMSVGALVGTQIGVSLLNRMSSHVFFILFRGVLLLAAVKIIFVFPWSQVF